MRNWWENKSKSKRSQGAVGRKHQPHTTFVTVRSTPILPIWSSSWQTDGMEPNQLVETLKDHWDQLPNQMWNDNTEGIIQIPFECWHTQDINHLSGKPVAVSDHTHIIQIFPHVQSESPLENLYTLLQPFTKEMKEAPPPALLCIRQLQKAMKSSLGLCFTEFYILLSVLSLSL